MQAEVCLPPAAPSANDALLDASLRDPQPSGIRRSTSSNANARLPSVEQDRRHGHRKRRQPEAVVIHSVASRMRRSRYVLGAYAETVLRKSRPAKSGTSAAPTVRSPQPTPGLLAHAIGPACGSLPFGPIVRLSRRAAVRTGERRVAATATASDGLAVRPSPRHE